MFHNIVTSTQMALYKLIKFDFILNTGATRAPRLGKVYFSSVFSNTSLVIAYETLT